LPSPLHATKISRKEKRELFFYTNGISLSTFCALRGLVRKSFFRMEKENVFPRESHIISFLIISYLLFQYFLFHQNINNFTKKLNQ